MFSGWPACLPGWLARQLRVIVGAAAGAAVVVAVHYTVSSAKGGKCFRCERNGAGSHGLANRPTRKERGREGRRKCSAPFACISVPNPFICCSENNRSLLNQSSPLFRSCTILEGKFQFDLRVGSRDVTVSWRQTNAVSNCQTKLQNLGTAPNMSPARVRVVNFYSSRLNCQNLSFLPLHHSPLPPTRLNLRVRDYA